MTNKRARINIHQDFSLDTVVGINKPSSFINRVHRWAQAKSLWPYYMGGGCCDRSLNILLSESGPFSDLSKTADLYEPAQADLLIISGTINTKRYCEIKRTYDQMSSPKWVMVIGACACSGGLFSDFTPAERFFDEIPVDVFVPGCPPSAKMIFEGFQLIQEKIKKCGFKDNQ